MRIFWKNGRPAVRTWVWRNNGWEEVVVYLDTPRPTREDGIAAELKKEFVAAHGRRGGYARRPANQQA